MFTLTLAPSHPVKRAAPRKPQKWYTAGECHPIVQAHLKRNTEMKEETTAGEKPTVETTPEEKHKT